MLTYSLSAKFIFTIFHLAAANHKAPTECKKQPLLSTTVAVSAPPGAIFESLRTVASSMVIDLAVLSGLMSIYEAMTIA